MSDAARHIRSRLPRIAALVPGEAVPSPCNCVCRMDPRTGHCDGCLRTVEEITYWTALSDAGKRDVWRQLESRAAGELDEALTPALTTALTAALTPTLSRREREQGN